MALSAGQGCGAGPLGRGRLAGRGGATRRTARPPAATVIPIVPTDAAGGAEAQGGWSDGVNATRSPRGGGQRRRGADTERHSNESPNTRARTAPAALQATGEIERHPVESPNTRARTAAAIQAAGEIERHPVESPNTRARIAAASAGGRSGMTTGLLASASQRETVTGANLNRTTAPTVAGQGGDG